MISMAGQDVHGSRSERRIGRKLLPSGRGLMTQTRLEATLSRPLAVLKRTTHEAAPLGIAIRATTRYSDIENLIYLG